MTVGLVLVSHSAKLAEGLKELATQMAGDITIIAAGGTEEGGIGTSYDRVEQATRTILDSGNEVLILTDLGSATMTVEMLLDFLNDEPVRFADAPFVEATVSAAVTAQGGANLDEVYNSAMGAAASFISQNDTISDERRESEHPHDATYSRNVTVADSAGLHARPAAAIAEMALDSDTTINGEAADSPLGIMGLGVNKGDTVTVAGSDATTVDRIADAIQAGLD